MRRSHLYGAVILLCVVPVLAGTPADELFGRAARLAAEQTWDRAIDANALFAERYPHDPRAVAAEYWSLRLREHLPRIYGDWLKELERFAARRPGTLWALRARWLAQRFGYGEPQAQHAAWLALAADYRAALAGSPTPALRAELGHVLLSVDRSYGRDPGWRPSALREQMAYADEALGLGVPALSAEALVRLSELHERLAAAARAWRKYQGLLRRWPELKFMEEGDQEPVDLDPAAERRLAEGCLLRVVREFGSQPAALPAWIRLARRAEEERHYELALARYHEALQRCATDGQTQEVTARIRHLTAPNAGVALDEIHLPGARIQGECYVRNTRGVRFAVYRLDAHRWATRQEPDEAQLGPHTPRVAAWHVPVVDDGSHRPRRFPFTVLIAKPGLYMLNSVADGAPKTLAHKLLQVTRLAVEEHRYGGDVVAYVVDRLTRRPVPEAKVMLGRWEEDEEADTRPVGPPAPTAPGAPAPPAAPMMNPEMMRQMQWGPRPARTGMIRWVVTGQTDADGLCRLTVPPSRDDMPMVNVYAFALGEVAASEPDYVEPSLDDEPAGYACTDRSVYRPGSVLHYAAVLRERIPGGGYRPYPAGPVTVWVAGGNGKLIDSPARVDDDGIAAGEVALPTDARLGDYRLAMVPPGQRPDDESERPTLALVEFAVEEYRKPQYTVTVGRPAAPPRPGQRVAVPVLARYYNGTPVADASVRWRASAVRSVPKPPRAQRWSWVATQRPGDSEWFGESRSAGHGETRTDAHGTALIELDTIARGSWRYDIAATVYDLGRETARGSGSFAVPNDGVFLYPQTDRLLYRPDQTAKLTITALAADGRPAAARVTVTLNRQHQVPPVAAVPAPPRPWAELDEAERQAYRQLVKRLRSPHDEAEAELWQQAVSTDDATGEATLGFAAPPAGRYQLVLEAPDPLRPTATVRSTADFCSAGDAGLPHDETVGREVRLTASQSLAREGETLRLLVRSPLADVPVLLSIAGDRLDTRLLRLRGHSGTVELPLTREHLPSVNIEALVVGAREVYDGELTVRVAPVAEVVDVAVTSDRNEYHPRDQARLSVRTTDSAGQPVSARVCLGVADESVYALHEDPAGDPAWFFWGRLRYGRLERGRPSGRGVGWDEDLLARIAPDEPPPPTGPDDEPDDWALDLGPHLGWHRQGGGGAEDEGLFNAAGGSASAPPSPYGSMGAMGGPGGPGEVPRAGAVSVNDQVLFTPFAAPARVDFLLAGSSGIARREFFPDTAFWRPDLRTGPDGQAEVTFDLPDSATTWRATARAVTPETRAGQQTATLVTSRELLIALRAPRFLTQLDRATISALVANRTAERLSAAVDLAADGLAVDGPAAQTVVLEPHGQARVDWTASAVSPGAVDLTATARAGELADAVKETLVVIPHGAEQFAAAAGKAPANGRVALDLNLPPACRPGSAALTVALQPSLAASLLDALPSLLEEPTNCAEQLVSGLVSAVWVAKTLGYRLSPPNGPMPPRRQQAPPWWKQRRLTELSDLLNSTWQKLNALRSGDGYAWAPNGPPDPVMTAYVVWARNQLVPQPQPGTAELGPQAVWLARRLPDLAGSDGVYVAWALSGLRSLEAETRRTLRRSVATLFDQRANLDDTGRALLVLTLANLGDRARLDVAWRNLLAHRVPSADGLHWGNNTGDGWSDGPVQATAYGLLAALRMDRSGAVAGGAASWLAANRRGCQWDTTWDTASAIHALCAYAARQKETGATYRAVLTVNGRPAHAWDVTPGNALEVGAPVRLDPALLQVGDNRLELRREGTGSLYYDAMLTWYTAEEPIPSAANRIAATRRYTRIVPVGGAKEGEPAERREPLAPGQPVASGEVIEAEVTLKADNVLSYVVLHDPKPAGFEPTAQRSGESRGAYQELRDREVVYYLARLPQGETVLRYRLRAVAPGEFHALPAAATAKYRPEVRCLSDEVRWTVTSP